MLTRNRTYDTTPAVGRKKLYPERITLPLTAEMLERVDALLEPEEERVVMIREAIDRELKRRERKRREGEKAD